MNKYKLLPVKPSTKCPGAGCTDQGCPAHYAPTPEASKLIEALERLVFAAHRRDNSTGDQIRLIEIREELSAAAKNAEEVLVAFCKLREGSK